MTEPLPDQTSPIPSQPTTSGVKRSLMKLIPLFVIAIIAIAGLIIFANRVGQETSPDQLKLTEGTSVPNQYAPVRGIVTAKTDNSLTVKVDNQDQTYTLANSVNIQKQGSASGSVNVSTPKLLPLSSIESGTLVSLEIDKNTNQVAAILILTPEFQATLVSGTVTAYNQKSISLKVEDSNEIKTYALPENVRINRASKISEISNVKVGDKIHLALDKDNKVITILVRK